ncbi:PepSY domain-containing protein [Xanthobacter agilis]|jgi:hypothetical protein|uniref:PepSY domain-containing protein n=1 Tax=Xanthobacter agilis TaxID=47492 RepID=A0ABU0LIJ6_XANAG|nr:PepSY domain-containing protein [Xanthobacter agilis]MDQ0506965.1 hypothetical protein [Xanthobacter agilis]
MKMQILAAMALLMVSSGAAFADRALTADEQEKVQAALTAQGCKGGSMKVDDGLFEVDNATCADGHVYDFKFGPDYKLLHKDFEH